MTDETILCIAPRRWDSLWRSTQQTISRIAKQNRVFYFEPGRDAHGGLLSEIWRNFPHFFTLRPKAVHENLIVIPTPPCVPIGRRHFSKSALERLVPLVNAVNNRVLLRHLRWAVKRFRIQQPVLWLYSPYDSALIGKVGEKLSCYYNYDEFGEFAGNEKVKTILQRADNHLCSLVDVVFATSRSQWSRRKAINPNSYFIPNGVDFDTFHQALDPGLALPSDLERLPRPIIGFAGWLGYHLDILLFRKVAEAYPEGSLVLVGPDELPSSPDRQRLSELDNVFFLGQKKLQELPAYLKAFDVALMPWNLSWHGRSAYPLKLHEYLAAGRAVVATALPEVRPFHQVIRIAETHDEFLNYIQAALSDSTPEAVEQRVAVARENTWDARVEEIYRALDSPLQRAAQAMAA